MSTINTDIIPITIPDTHQHMPEGRNVTAEDIIAMCNNADWKEFQLVMPNGDILGITPCSYGACSADSVEYFLVDGPMPWMGEDTAEKLAKSLNTYQQQLDEAAAEKVKLEKFYQNHIVNGENDDDAWSFYSDWHKDVYGFRPKHRPSR